MLPTMGRNHVCTSLKLGQKIPQVNSPFRGLLVRKCWESGEKRYPHLWCDCFSDDPKWGKNRQPPFTKGVELRVAFFSKKQKLVLIVPEYKDLRNL